MDTIRMDPVFAAGLHQALECEIAGTRAVRRRRIGLGAGVLGVLALAGAGAGVATAALSTPPGTPVYAPVSEGIGGTFTGDGSIDLGTPPANATSIRFTITCLSEGSVDIDGYGSIPCFADEVGSTRSGAVPLTLSQQSVLAVAATEGTAWSIDAGYSTRVDTEWATNAAGQTYGAQKGDRVADLVPATATNGQRGYISSAESEAASGGTLHSQEEVDQWMSAGVYEDHYIPVYASDGTTVIGQYLIAGQPRPIS